jgi:hypothetical protein
VRRQFRQRGDGPAARRAALAPAVREAVEAGAAARIDEVELVRRSAQPQVVAAVLGDEQAATARRDGEAVGVAQPARLEPQPTAARPERDDGAGELGRRRVVVGLAADAQIEPAAGPRDDRVEAVAADREPVDDDARAREPELSARRSASAS